MKSFQNIIGAVSYMESNHGFRKNRSHVAPINNPKTRSAKQFIKINDLLGLVFQARISMIFLEEGDEGRSGDGLGQAEWYELQGICDHFSQHSRRASVKSTSGDWMGWLQCSQPSGGRLIWILTLLGDQPSYLNEYCACKYASANWIN